MPRNKKCRMLNAPPCCSRFKPAGIPGRFLEKVVITLDEYESIRLADFLNLEHEEASGKMGISRSIFTRLVQTARQKVARAIVEGCELVIEGGEYHFQNKSYRCTDCSFIESLKMEETIPEACPFCGSGNILNLNDQFGGKGHCRRHGIEK